MIGVGFKILTRTPVPKLPQAPLPPSLILFIFCLCKLCAISFFATSCPYYAILPRSFFYSDDSHPAACEMLETGAMSIRRTSKPFFRTPVDLNLEQIIPMLKFHPDLRVCHHSVNR